MTCISWHSSMLYFTLYFKNLKKTFFEIKSLSTQTGFFIILKFGLWVSLFFFPGDNTFVRLSSIPVFSNEVSPMRMLYVEDIAPNVERWACVWTRGNSMSPAVLVMWKSPKMWLLRKRKWQLCTLGNKEHNPAISKHHWWGLCLWQLAAGRLTGEGAGDLIPTTLPAREVAWVQWFLQVSLRPFPNISPKLFASGTCSFSSPQEGVTSIADCAWSKGSSEVACRAFLLKDSRNPRGFYTPETSRLYYDIN